MPKQASNDMPRNPQGVPLPDCASCGRHGWDVAEIEPDVTLRCKHCGGKRTITIEEWRCEG